jgi:hypothetical protein
MSDAFWKGVAVVIALVVTALCVMGVLSGGHR